VDNTVTIRANRKYRNAILGTVALQSRYLLGRLRLGNGQMLILSWNIVVGACRHLLWAKYPYTTLAQARKSLRTCHLVYVLTVDVEYARTSIKSLDGVRIPYFVE
jgi:hypothetical protein